MFSLATLSRWNQAFRQKVSGLCCGALLTATSSLVKCARFWMLQFQTSLRQDPSHRPQKRSRLAGGHQLAAAHSIESSETLSLRGESDEKIQKFHDPSTIQVCSRGNRSNDSKLAEDLRALAKLTWLQPVGKDLTFNKERNIVPAFSRADEFSRACASLHSRRIPKREASLSKKSSSQTVPSHLRKRLRRKDA